MAGKIKGVTIETKVSPAQHRKFRKLCKAKKTSMTAKLAEIIAYMVKGMK